MSNKYNPVRGCKQCRCARFRRKPTHNSIARGFVKKETNRKIRRFPENELPLVSEGHWG